MDNELELSFLPLSPQNWDDLETLFGPRGATGGCWCMWFRISRAQYDAQRGDGNRQALKELVDGGITPGILAYHDEQPVGWCSLAPREEYASLKRSRLFSRIDAQPVWSLVCFFVSKDYRRRGVTRHLLQAALEYARSRGARIVEAYPVEPKKDEIPAVFAYHGLAETFCEAGFVEVARRSETRPMMRYYLDPP